MTPEAAAAYRELLVKDQQGHTSRASSISKGQKLFNFHVLRWTKGKNVQRLILQVSYIQ